MFSADSVVKLSQCIARYMVARFRLRFSLRQMFLLVLVAAVFMSWARYEINARALHRMAADESHCLAHLVLISSALQDYCDYYGRFPPAYTVDSDGRRMHSWRVLLLPHFGSNEQRKFYSQYRLDEPWNGPHNSALTRLCPDIYRCPAASSETSEGETNYVVVCGEETMFPPDGSTTRGEISQPEYTLAIVEATRSGVIWTEPRDFELDSMKLTVGPSTGHNISANHVRGPNVALANGPKDTLLRSTTPDDLLDMLRLHTSPEKKRRAALRSTVHAE